MKKIIIILLIFILSSCNTKELKDFSLIEQKINKISIGKDYIKVGYCPTMLAYIPENMENKKIKFIKYDSTQEIMKKLKNNEIDIAFVGRIAKNYEITKNTKNLKLLDEERFTYISDIKIGLKESDIEKMSEKLQLISWNDWQDNNELAVIIDDFGNKIEKYRFPILYYKTNSLVKY